MKNFVIPRDLLSNGRCPVVYHIKVQSPIGLTEEQIQAVKERLDVTPNRLDEPLFIEDLRKLFLEFGFHIELTPCISLP